jgi:hypothetical protein
VPTPEELRYTSQLVETSSYTTHHKGGWHVLLWLGHLDEVNAHIY